MNEADTIKPKRKSIFQFGSIATIVGFIVDTITLTSILLSIHFSNTANIELTIPSFITPGFAYGIWVIAVYTYFTILHSYWRKNHDEVSFAGFLAGVFFKFSKPLILFPAIILFLLLIWIITLDVMIFMNILGVAFIGFVIFAFGSAIYYQTFGEDVERKNAKKLIDENWQSLKKKIKRKLADNVWLNYADFADIANVWEVSTKHFDYAFAKYALENPTAARYASIYRKKDNKCVSGKDNVLVNLESLDEDLYFLSTKNE